MILRAFDQAHPLTGSTESAWQFVEQSQQRATMPLVLIPQPAHAVLSGALAKALLPTVFGDLPANIIQAIRMHDTGWGIVDAAQIHSLRGDDKETSAQPKKKNIPPVQPHSFLTTPTAESVAAWKASIEETQKIAPECGYIVSRHFTLLCLPVDPLHSAFKKYEQARQQSLLKSASLPHEILERWVDALGFCDLLSLVLCSGETADLSLSLSHPARDSAAPAIRLQLHGEKVHLHHPILPAGTEVYVDGLRHPAPSSGSAAHHLRWIFA